MPARAVRRALIAGAALVASCAAVTAGAAASRPSGSPTVHLRGTAYEFNHTGTLLAGATIRVAEFPKLSATVRSDGTYDLAVPAHAAVTPYIVAAGHHTIYLQTFTTAGADLANVNFQTPSDGDYRALAAILHVPVDANGNPTACAIVSTFSTRNVRDLPYRQFIAYGAHGVAGATATGTPALPKPVYFNSSVIPDATQTVSSDDGGVVWTGVPSGVYTISGHSRTTRFASFVATCRPGRIVNANPPWGLHELAPANPARATATWTVHGAQVALRSLVLHRVHAGSVARLGCSGAHCPFMSRTFSPATGTFDVRRALGAATAGRFRAGQTVSLVLTTHAFNGLVINWTLRSGRAPLRTALCLPLGDTAPAGHC
jgi:hypothetical protein